MIGLRYTHSPGSRIRHSAKSHYDLFTRPIIPTYHAHHPVKSKIGFHAVIPDTNVAGKNNRGRVPSLSAGLCKQRRHAAPIMTDV